jgi:type I restriction enzyme S subunit
MAEISKVPAIRFKGFSDEWIESPFDEVVDFFSGLTYSPKDVTTEPLYYVLQT